MARYNASQVRHVRESLEKTFTELFLDDLGLNRDMVLDTLERHMQHIGWTPVKGQLYARRTNTGNVPGSWSYYVMGAIPQEWSAGYERRPVTMEEINGPITKEKVAEKFEGIRANNTPY